VKQAVFKTYKVYQNFEQAEVGMVVWLKLRQISRPGFAGLLASKVAKRLNKPRPTKY
jgi:hypothetical protein